ncbi:MAG TPA: tRNA preQ1(34) S-adenosylmethionine ribosyltransferase-isomerase QueA, partial [candidate division Zixibacteria bacterium]|nr:tRNA preQ1(34) S-adenosylmethionine ribosyltransferase-isomerase QueA [candidate division Zixibacteria bacterium]
MDISLFDFELPDELIAQVPTRNRDESRLLVLNREDKSISTKSFKDITSYFKKGDCLVVNNTKVFKARLLGKRKSGGEVEVFLVRRLDKPHHW